MRLIFVIFIFIAFQLNSEKVKYTGSISLSEKRILGAKEEYLKSNQFPNEWKLFFKAKEGDFVVFYDWNGHELHYRYRRNKFDLDGETFVNGLFPGNPYKIKGELIGYYFYPLDSRGKRKSFFEKKSLPIVKQEFADIHTIPVFKLIGYDEVFSEELLY